MALILGKVESLGIKVARNRDSDHAIMPEECPIVSISWDGERLERPDSCSTVRHRARVTLDFWAITPTLSVPEGGQPEEGSLAFDTGGAVEAIYHGNVWEFGESVVTQASNVLTSSGYVEVSGPYDPLKTYRDGDRVEYPAGMIWRFIGTTPAAGQEPNALSTVWVIDQPPPVTITSQLFDMIGKVCAALEEDHTLNGQVQLIEAQEVSDEQDVGADMGCISVPLEVMFYTQRGNWTALAI